MTQEEKVNKLLEIARAQIGKPYKYGACYEEGVEDPQSFDCSSFTQYVFKQIGIDIPRSSILQATMGAIVNEPLKPGDLVFFEGERGYYRKDFFPPEKFKRNILIGHVAIYTGDGNIIHAANNGTCSGVAEQPFDLLPSPSYIITIIKRLL